jgi:hypothetical protein
MDEPDKLSYFIPSSNSLRIFESQRFSALRTDVIVESFAFAM